MQRGKQNRGLNRKKRIYQAHGIERLEERTLFSQSLQMSITPQTVQVAGVNQQVTVAVKFTGPSVNTTSFGDGNFLAEGPNGYNGAVGYAGLDPQDPGAGHGYRLADYYVNLPDDPITPSDNGIYYLDPQPNQVSDQQLGYLLPTARVEAFDVEIQYVYPLSVTLDGQALPNTGAAIDFGSTPLAFPGAIKTLDVTNVLSQPVTITTENTAETFFDLGGEYTIVDLNGQLSGTTTLTLAPGASTTFQLQFAPSGSDISSYLLSGLKRSSFQFDVTPDTTPVPEIQDFDFQVSGTIVYNPVGERLSGNVYNDANGNGQIDANEGVANVQVYVDLNNDGVYDSTTEPEYTTGAGDFDFGDMPAGNYTIRAILPAGFVQDSPAPGNGITVAVSANNLVDQTNLNFTVSPAATISGTVYSDTNDNGSIDAGEPGVAGQTVYLDSNNNGQLDNGEPTTITDSAGHYSFAVTPTNQFVVRLVEAAGAQEVPDASAGRPVYVSSAADYGGNDFLLKAGAEATDSDAIITGTVYIDTNADGTIDGGDGGVDGQSVYLDLNNNGQFDAGEPTTMTANGGHYSFTVTPGNSFVVRLGSLSGLAQQLPASSAGITVIATTAAVYDTGNDFLVVTPAAVSPFATISGTVYTDTNADGSFDSGDAPAAGQTVYIDTNNNGIYDTGEPATTSDSAGQYSIAVPSSGEYILRVSSSSDGSSTTLPKGEVVEVTGGGTFDGNNIVVPPPGSATVPIEPITPEEELAQAKSNLKIAQTSRVTQINAGQKTVNQDLKLYRTDLKALHSAQRTAHSEGMSAGSIDPTLQSDVSLALTTLTTDRTTLRHMRTTDFTGIAELRKAIVADRKQIITNSKNAKSK